MEAAREFYVEPLEYEVVWGKAGRMLSNYRARHDAIQKYGFAVPNRKAIGTLVDAGPLLEVGAGKGYWSYEIRRMGGDVIATDNHEFANHEVEGKIHFDWKEKWTEVETLDGVSAVRKYPDRTLFICWPSYQESWPADTIKAYTGKKLFLVTEGPHGCCGGDDMWDELGAHWDYDHWVRIPQWEGIHDRLELYIRK